MKKFIYKSPSNVKKNGKTYNKSIVEEEYTQPTIKIRTEGEKNQTSMDFKFYTKEAALLLEQIKQYEAKLKQADKLLEMIENVSQALPTLPESEQQEIDKIKLNEMQRILEKYHIKIPVWTLALQVARNHLKELYKLELKQKQATILNINHENGIDSIKTLEMLVPPGATKKLQLNNASIVQQELTILMEEKQPPSYLLQQLQQEIAARQARQHHKTAEIDATEIDFTVNLRRVNTEKKTFRAEKTLSLIEYEQLEELSLAAFVAAEIAENATVAVVASNALMYRPLSVIPEECDTSATVSEELDNAMKSLEEAIKELPNCDTKDNHQLPANSALFKVKKIAPPIPAKPSKQFIADKVSSIAAKA